MDPTALPQIQQLIKQVDGKILILVLQIIAICFVAGLIRDFVQALIGYIEFKSNPYVCIGRRVIVNDFEGIIERIGIRFIVIKNNKRTLLVQTSKWKDYEWSFLTISMPRGYHDESNRMGNQTSQNR